MAGYGPPPKHPSQRRRRNAPMGGNVLHRLPAAGREGAPPDWPLPRKPRPAVQAIWERLWRAPQAAMWEQLGWYDVLARYATLLAAKLSLEILKEVRQLEDRLGLTPIAMLRLRWEVADEDEEAAPVAEDNVLDIRNRVAAVE